MNVHSKLALAAAAGAMVMGSAAPASARGYDGRWDRYPRHHRGHDNSGAVIGAIIGVGLIAAIATAAARQRDADRYPTRRPGDRGYDPRYDDRAGDYRNDRYDDGYDGRPAGQALDDEDAAVDACAIAARDQASRDGNYAEVRDITGARPFGSGWDVTGTLSMRSNFRAGEGRLRSFRCIWDDGRVDCVTFG
ncbi:MULTISPECIES: hypothetical protein [Sphingobium]|uniref:hypothetical protein n=1 Tax=Sphingobium TaxID=165695 RepID=UPI0015EB6745|nr:MULTISPECIES: hypothetical protein [Sphingobium]MCW2363894.1 hypothetical protein [Sphingobium sp. B10D3B]MCW2402709.1 hypothetical protein [Sphingobium sp. B10D7B]MCW2409688.1 hypothetical protein [Sphingobium xanthum]